MTSPPPDQLVQQPECQEGLAAPIRASVGDGLKRRTVLIVIDDDEAARPQEWPEQGEVAVDAAVGVVHERANLTGADFRHHLGTVLRRQVLRIQHHPVAHAELQQVAFEQVQIRRPITVIESRSALALLH